MRALVVHAHPSEASFSAALFVAASGALRAAGHDVATIDLYAERFNAVMSADERRAYHSDQPILDAVVGRHAELVRWADTLVFVYPTWWMGLPAILKGWVDLEFEDGRMIRIEEGDSLFIPGYMRHNEIRTSETMEILEVSVPGTMGTTPCDPPPRWKA